MPLLPIDGTRGSGGTEVGTRVAEALNASYVDRLLVRKAAEHAKAPTKELLGRAGREHRPKGLLRWLGRSFERWFDLYSRNALYVNPWEGFAFLGHLPESAVQGLASQPTAGPFVDDKRFIRAMGSALDELAQVESLVVVGRGAGMLLKDRSDALHVGLSAAFSTRVLRNMRKHQMSATEAAKFTRETDEARRRYYRKFFDADPDDPTLFDLSLDTGTLSADQAVELIVSRASVLGDGHQN